jgi:hypothetical protein
VLGPRATTPFYATPYSNAPFVDTRPTRGGVLIIDDDIDFDFDDGESESDIDVYDDEAEDTDNAENLHTEADDDDSSMADLGTAPYQTQSQESWQDGQVPEAPEAPEDEPWPGIEDVENRNPDCELGVEMNVHVDDDIMADEDVGDRLTTANPDEDDTQSQGSSVPSEYPSNQPPWVTSGREQEFRVFGDR